ncbi:hypothetical protein Lfu02_03460 [Longispora fulva]|nr:hypothetical protein Lfu02_03460 [Longispora fulva]
MVFLGPSLDPAEAAGLCDAEYLPPVGRGDIDALLGRERPPDRIGIVDGAFFQRLSISPKEVLCALDRGVRVWGAASMGALRAVECAPYGMVGVGRIYAEYAAGRIEADDEVAIAYDPDTGRPVSEPLVNLRFAVADAVAAGTTTRIVADRFLAVAKELYFPQRRTGTVLALLADELAPAEHTALAEHLRTRAPDTKREDALELLRAIGDPA